MRGRHLHHTSYSIIARSALENMADSNIYSESFADVLYPQYFPSVKSTHHYHDQNETNDRIIPKKYRSSLSLFAEECHSKDFSLDRIFQPVNKNVLAIIRRKHPFHR